jgi:hypothetical protein
MLRNPNYRATQAVVVAGLAAVLYHLYMLLFGEVSEVVPMQPGGVLYSIFHSRYIIDYTSIEFLTVSLVIPSK